MSQWVSVHALITLILDALKPIRHDILLIAEKVINQIVFHSPRYWHQFPSAVTHFVEYFNDLLNLFCTKYLKKW